MADSTDIVTVAINEENRKRRYREYTYDGNNDNDEDNVHDNDNDNDNDNDDSFFVINKQGMVKIPSLVLVKNVLPFLDHDTWKSFSIVSNEIYKITCQKYPPTWPTTCPTINLKENFQRMLFNPIGGTRLAMLTSLKHYQFNYSKDNNNSVAIYDRRQGFVKRLKYGPAILRTTNISRIEFLDMNTLLVITESDHQHDHFVFLSRIDDEKIILLPQQMTFLFCNRIVTKDRTPTIFNQKNRISYIATIHYHGVFTTTENKLFPEKIFVNKYDGSVTNSENCLKEVYCLEYPVKKANVIDLQLQFLRCDDDDDTDNYDANGCEKLLLVSVTITEDGTRYVHCWQLNHDHDQKPNPIPMSYGSIPKFHPDDVIGPWNGNGYDSSFSDNGEYMGAHFKICTTTSSFGSSNNNNKLRIIETYPTWWNSFHEFKQEFELDGVEDGDELYNSTMNKFNHSNVLVWENNDNNNNNKNNTRRGFELKNDFLMKEPHNDGRKDSLPLVYSSIGVSTDDQFLVASSYERVSNNNIITYCQIDNTNSFLKYDTHSNDTYIGNVKYDQNTIVTYRNDDRKKITVNYMD